MKPNTKKILIILEENDVRQSILKVNQLHQLRFSLVVQWCFLNEFCYQNESSQWVCHCLNTQQITTIRVFPFINQFSFTRQMITISLFPAIDLISSGKLEKMRDELSVSCIASYRLTLKISSEEKFLWARGGKFEGNAFLPLSFSNRSPPRNIKDESPLNASGIHSASSEQFWPENLKLSNYSNKENKFVIYFRESYLKVNLQKCLDDHCGK